jgi:exodeoxyribonuclease V gamma subunit
MLDARLDGCDARAVCLAEIARGHLPPGVLGQPVVEELFATVERIVEQVDDVLGDGHATSADVRVELSHGRVLTGTLGGLRGDAIETTTYSKVAAKHRLTAWVRLLALTATYPEHARRAVTIGRGADDGIAVATIPPLTGDEARARLEVLVDLHERAVREPLPMACKTSAAYAAARRADRDPRRAACSEWESGRFDREDAEPEHVLAFGGRRPFDDLIGEPPAADEAGHGWDHSEASRFGRLAVRLWEPLLDVEERREL